MGNKKRVNGKKTQTKPKSDKKIYVVLSAVILTVVFSAVVYFARGGSDDNGSGASSGGDLVIPKSEITETAKFYSYKAGKTNMEVLAIKASDGTIRTAFNTCQVCYDSGRGYYVQDGNEVVCQNCGNRFKNDKIEVVKGGCNPVPIFKENKVDDGENIIIKKEFLEQDEYKTLFSNWKKS
ncbi:MAG: Fe-S-containing protein [Bacillota bacterium]